MVELNNISFPRCSQTSYTLYLFTCMHLSLMEEQWWLWVPIPCCKVDSYPTKVIDNSLFRATSTCAGQQIVHVHTGRVMSAVWESCLFMDSMIMLFSICRQEGSNHLYQAELEKSKLIVTHLCGDTFRWTKCGQRNFLWHFCKRIGSMVPCFYT